MLPMLCCRQSEKKPAKAPQKYGRGLEPKTGKKCSGFPERRSASGNYGLVFPAFRRTATMLHILATSISDRPNQVFPTEFAAALETDGP